METFSAWLAICAGNSPVPGEFPAQRPVTRSFDVFFELRLNKRLSKQPWGWWFETPAWSLWRHRNGLALLSFGCNISYWNILVIHLLMFVRVASRACSLCLFIISTKIYGLVCPHLSRKFLVISLVRGRLEYWHVIHFAQILQSFPCIFIYSQKKIDKQNHLREGHFSNISISHSFTFCLITDYRVCWEEWYKEYLCTLVQKVQFFSQSIWFKCDSVQGWAK